MLIDKDKQYKWLITGCAGFIGSNLMEQLLLLNQKVVGLDNFSSGYQSNIDTVLAKIPESQRKNFRLLTGDIRNWDDCQRATENIDYILHHAALCSVPYSLQEPLLTDAINVHGFTNILLAAKQAKVKRIVYASSSAVYGNAKNAVLPKDENHPVEPLSPYAASKYINEIHAKTFANCYNLETVGLRYFNVYGPRQDPKGAYAAVIPIWANSLFNNQDVFIYGDGETTRDFCYVGDVVQANLLAALVNKENIVNGAVYNIGFGEKITLNELLKMICLFMHLTTPCKTHYKDFRAGDVRHSVSKIDKAKTSLGYCPKHNLNQGLSLTLPWYTARIV